MPELKEEFLKLAETAHIESPIFPFFKNEKKSKKLDKEE
jgi:hypothetical protein